MRHFLATFYIKTIILPRHARDKHRENSKKVPFSYRDCVLRGGLSRPGVEERGVGDDVLSREFRHQYAGAYSNLTC
jgi:hypothetical protein